MHEDLADLSETVVSFVDLEGQLSNLALSSPLALHFPKAFNGAFNVGLGIDNMLVDVPSIERLKAGCYAASKGGGMGGGGIVLVDPTAPFSRVLSTFSWCCMLMS
jgi:hypothetical protein